MADVVIHRCTLRVIRRSGWSWGADPKRVAEGAVRALPELLARKLSELFADDAEREIAAPVRVRLPIRMSELLGDSSVSVPRISPSGTRAMASLEQRMDASLRAALGLGPAPAAASPPIGRARSAVGNMLETPSAGAAQTGGALQRLLSAWTAQGVLARQLAALSYEQIRSWHDYLWRGVASAVISESETDSAEQIERFVRARAPSSVSADVAETLRRRLLVAAEVAAQLSLPLTHLGFWRVLDRIVPLEPPTVTHTVVANDPDSVSPVRSALVPRDANVASRLGADAPVVRAAAATQRQPREWETKVACALPFLLLGPLARAGYLAALEAVLEAAHLSDQALLFAAALAYKVLDPPRRGWQRGQESVLAAAAFAGSSNPITEESLVELSRRMTPHTGALDLILADSLIAGHGVGEPVTLHSAGARTPGTYLLMDTQGCFPIAWVGLEPLPAMLRRLGPPIVLICDDAAEPQLLRELDAAGMTFVCGLPPSRHERWERIQQGSTVLGWSNSRELATEPLLHAARLLPAALAETKDFARDLIDVRPSIIHSTSSQFDRSVTLAASVALGMISWQLWRTRGRTSPQQVLERFADLDGSVQFRTASIHVELPLGRRRLELSASGLLAPIDGVPWLPHRRVEFAGGRR